ncbi:MAG: hypothetical protein QGH83_06225 [Candidatus Pacebacteria bacterium]|nr:hypothetical protein [Candidatus Paceibacterota bacterium]
MPTNTKGKLEITDLGFDEIKANLKTYLKGQSEFTDYDFEGSGLSVLLDVLSYNTHYNAFMANMLANEMFLDTAVKRNSIVSHAQSLGYTPQSARAPIATVNIEVGDAQTSTLTMPAGQVFTTQYEGTGYQFVNITAKTITPDSGVYAFYYIPLYEGTYITTPFTVNLSDADQKFIIPNNDVDTTTLSVSVQNSSSDTTTTTYTLGNNLVDVVGTSTVYFIQETTGGEWEIYFGDGVVGKALIDGNIINVSYIVTNKTESNGAATFRNTSPIGGFTDITVWTVNVASGGAEPESVGSIKYNAPFSYTSQRRAVTANDYKVLVPQLYPNVQSISAWGGEYNDPAVYGKVYISIRSTTGDTLTHATKNSIVSQLKDYTVASITPEIIDPVTTKIIPTVILKFNQEATTKTDTDLETEVTTAISNFSDNELESFEGLFRYSKFIKTIDDTDISILSNITTIELTQPLEPTLSTVTKYTISFNNAFYHPQDDHTSILDSTGFVTSSNTNTLYFNDDGSGNVRTYYLTGSAKTYVDSTAGTIDYGTGKVVIDSIEITSVSNDSGTITLKVVPSSNDIVAVRNNVLEIDTTNMSITAEADTIASGSSNAGTAYTTYPSRGSSVL